MSPNPMRVVLLYEHPTWSRELIARMGSRDLDLITIDVGAVGGGKPTPLEPQRLWINRVNAMPSAGRPASVVAATGHLLTSLALQGQRVVNGSATHRIGGSKAAQAVLFDHLGLGTPASIAIHEPQQAVAAATQLGFPIITKPNIGGSGSGIVRYDSATELEVAVIAGDVELGIDGTGLVQRVIESVDGMVYRIEMLGDDLFYATKQKSQPGVYNYCAADGCAVQRGADAIELFTPAQSLVDAAAQIMRAAEADVGGVEFLLDNTTGEPSFYDFNPYSNFVSGFEQELGFDPIDRYLDTVFARH